MYKKVKIAPSILSASQLDMRRDIDEIVRSGADLIHVDVMDGHFVPNLTFGLPLIKQLNETYDIPLDVHLMISNPVTVLQDYIDEGSDIITVHYEACSPEEIANMALRCHGCGVKFACAIKPNTPAFVLDNIISSLDMVLVMSVEPGFSGQSFMESAVNKVAEVVAIASAHNIDVDIEVDGGIGVGTASRVCAAGADVLVCGNACFGYEDRNAAITNIKADAEIGRLAGIKKMEALQAYM